MAITTLIKGRVEIPAQAINYVLWSLIRSVVQGVQSVAHLKNASFIHRSSPWCCSPTHGMLIKIQVRDNFSPSFLICHVLLTFTFLEDFKL
jgi:hypothetical protein